METQPSASIFDLQIDQDSRAHLTEISKWGKFLAITGLVLGGLIIIGGIFVLLIRPSLGDSFGADVSMLGFAGIIYLMAGALYIYPSIKLLQFSNQMPEALQKNDQALASTAFGNMKTMFKFWGVVTIVVIGLYVLALIAGVIFGAFSSMG